MIKSFQHKGLKEFWETGSTKGIPVAMASRIDARLKVINNATVIDDIDLPGYNLHGLKGNRKGTWAIKVTGNWRITFKFVNGNAYFLDLEDYH